MTVSVFLCIDTGVIFIGDVNTTDQQKLRGVRFQSGL